MNDSANWYNARVDRERDKCVTALCHRWWRFAYWKTVYTDHVVRAIYLNLSRRSIVISVRENYD